MAVMCEECKCSISLDDKPDGTRVYGGCENECKCCNKVKEKQVMDTYYEYWTPERLKCTVCGELNLDEMMCFNCKGSRECLNCCGCDDIEEGK